MVLYLLHLLLVTVILDIIITIVVHEARGLKRKDGAPSDTYVKVSLVITSYLIVN